jgi:hypothetical protein
MLVKIDGDVDAYRYLWAKVVRGARLDRHCMACLIGPRVGDKKLKHGTLSVDVAPGEFLYICGVSKEYGRGAMTYEKNLHVVTRPSDVSFVRAKGYHGLEVTIDDAESLVIPELPDGHNGLDLRFTRCRNYQFAVAYFGQ